MMQMLGVRARPEGPDDQVWSANDHSDDDTFTYRHLEPQQPSQRAEHPHYVNDDSRVHEYFLVIFQLKWAAMYGPRPLWCLPWRAPGPPAPGVSGAGRRIARRRSPVRRPRRSARSATTASAWRPSRSGWESRPPRCIATTRVSTNSFVTRCSTWASNWSTAPHSPATQ